MRVLPASALLATALCAARPSLAQDATLSASGKGVAGGVLLGGELAAFAGGLSRLEPDWAFASAIALGAVAGAGAGFLVERDAEERASDVLLIAGMGLLVPVIVWVGDLRAPRPTEQLVLALGPALGAERRGASGVRLVLSSSWP